MIIHLFVLSLTVSGDAHSEKGAGDIWKFYPKNGETHHRRSCCLPVAERIGAAPGPLSE